MCFHFKDDNFVFNPITIDVCDKSEESTDVIDALLNSLKESAHICNLKCLENVSLFPMIFYICVFFSSPFKDQLSDLDGNEETSVLLK